MVGRRPLIGCTLKLVGVCLRTAGRDAVDGHLQAHDRDDPAFHDGHHGGFPVSGPGV